MDGSGDNQLTVRYNRRPLNRRVQMILHDYELWEQSLAIARNTNGTRHGQARQDVGMLNRDLALPNNLDTEADDSGFESGSES
ncbi:hypothetical protein AWZ03_003364 [Drosophila navojoa]|uniref:Uncharacterized protein n=1 Tax=Drosophila navojoa TaxID=7232 RepID=A0A484BN31_DRONA|nr:hypothetical protein AWZ03_003364 [Drosophila navojoa]